MYNVHYHAVTANIFQPLWTMAKNMFNPFYLETSSDVVPGQSTSRKRPLEGHTERIWGPHVARVFETPALNIQPI